MDCLDVFSRKRYFAMKNLKQKKPEEMLNITVEPTDYKSYDAPGYAFYCNQNEEIVFKEDAKEKV